MCIVLLLIILYYRNSYSEPFTTSKWYNPPESPRLLDLKSNQEPKVFTQSPIFFNTDFETPVFEQGWQENFLKTTLKEFYNKSIDQVVQARKNKRFQFNQTRPTTQKIPSVIHYVYIDSYYSPQSFTDQNIQTFKSQLDQIPQDMYIIVWLFKMNQNKWTQIREIDPRIHCLDIEEYNTVQYGADLFDIFYEHKQYSNCVEIVAYNILYKYGGIYLNFAFKEVQELSKLNQMLFADYIVTQKGFIILTQLIGAKPQSDVFWNYLLLLEDLYRYEKIVDTFTINQSSWSSSLGLTLVFDQFVNENEQYIPIQCSTSTYKGLVKFTHKDYLFTRKPILSRGVYYQKQNDPVVRKRYGVDLYDYFAQVDNIPLTTMVSNRQKLEDTFFDVLYHPLTSPKTNIPRMIHKIWLTQHRELTREQLRVTQATYDLLSPHWTIIFWINEPKNIPNTIAYFKKECPNLKIQPVLSEHITYGKKIYDAFLSEKRFAHAKDILVINLLYRLGGIYLDMGIDVIKDFSAIVQQYELVFYYELSPACRQYIEQCTTWNGNHIDIPIVGGQAGEPLFEKWLTNLENKGYKRYNKKYFSTAFNQVAFTATEYLTYLLDAFFSDRKVLFLTENSYFLRTHLSSWYFQMFTSSVDLWTIE